MGWWWWRGENSREGQGRSGGRAPQVGRGGVRAGRGLLAAQWLRLGVGAGGGKSGGGGGGGGWRWRARPGPGRGGGTPGSLPGAGASLLRAGAMHTKGLCEPEPGAACGRGGEGAARGRCWHSPPPRPRARPSPPRPPPPPPPTPPLFLRAPLHPLPSGWYPSPRPCVPPHIPGPVVEALSLRSTAPGDGQRTRRERDICVRCEWATSSPRTTGDGRVRSSPNLLDGLWDSPRFRCSVPLVPRTSERWIGVPLEGWRRPAESGLL